MQVYFTALFLTIAVEFIVYIFYIRSKPLVIFFYAVIINCLTHPAAFYFYSIFSEKSNLNNNFNVYFLIIEIVVFLAEILPIKFLFNIDLKKAVLISFSANIATAALSFVF
jgi:hypothetical protein